MEEAFWNWENSTGKFGELGIVPFEDIPSNDPDNVSDTESEADQMVPVEESISQSRSPINKPKHVNQGENQDSLDSGNAPETTECPQELDQEIPLRRSERIRKPMIPRSAWQPGPQAFHTGKKMTIPQDYTEAVSGPEKEK